MPVLTSVVDQAIAAMVGMPEVVVYAIIAVWVGLDSAGIPIPMEPVLLFTGALAAIGKTVLVLAVASTMLGALLFASVAYAIGRRFGAESVVRVGCHIGLSKERADHIELWLRHRGLLGVMVAAVCPILRTFSGYIMGVACVPRTIFTVGILSGALAYCSLWLLLGSALGANYRAPLRYLDSIGLLGLAIAIVLTVGVLVLHHLWGRYSLHRVALHFRHHQVAAAVAQRQASAL